MRTKKRRYFALVIVAALLLTPVSALACACCASTGSYFSGPTDLNDYQFGELQRMRFAKTASLYLTEAGLEEDAKGIDQPKRNYSLTGSLTGKVLKLSFRGGATTGVLELPLPATIWSHSADSLDRKLSAGGGPLLYKEWRMQGDVNGTGVFKAGTSSPAKYTLVLQGRGNGCDNAEDFTNWRVEVRGENARYAFHGKFTRPVQNR